MTLTPEQLAKHQRLGVILDTRVRTLVSEAINQGLPTESVLYFLTRMLPDLFGAQSINDGRACSEAVGHVVAAFERARTDT